MAINIGYPAVWPSSGKINNSDNQTIHQPKVNEAEYDFKSILEGKSSEVKELVFSRHANQRLISRNIDLSQEQLDRLNDGARKAQEKGIRESLVMMDDLAFIVNIPNSTVITALGESDNKVITNIDGAVIV